MKAGLIFVGTVTVLIASIGIFNTMTMAPLSLVIISVSISIGVAILSGLRPAVKATNINVLSALRRAI